MERTTYTFLVLSFKFSICDINIIWYSMSLYVRIMGLAAILCKNEQARSVIDDVEDPCEPTVAIASITLGSSSSSKLYMPSQVVIPTSLLQVVSVYKGVISLSSELGANLLSHNILNSVLYASQLFAPIVYKSGENDDKKR